MALNGVGEPAPTLLQTATQSVKIELYRQWQTYANGVHMDRDTFDSIDFEALALEALGAAGLTFTADAVAPVTVPVAPFVRDAVARPSDDLGTVTLAGTTRYPERGSAAWAEKHDQVQG